MKPRILTDEQRKVVNTVWEYYKKRLVWPSRKAILKELPKMDGVVKEFVKDPYGKKEVSLSFDTILAIPEAEQVLRPLPQLLRIAAQRFLEHPVFSTSQDKDFPRITHEDFLRIWPDRSQMRLARALFEMAHINIGGYSGRRDDEFYYYGCSVDALRYENVETLEEVLRKASSYPRRRIGAQPSGEHLQMMQAVFEYVKKQGRWPVALHFAVEHRGLGFIPDLVNELSMENAGVAFVQSRFKDTEHDRIELTHWALQFVDSSEELRSLFMRAVGVLGRMWIDSPEEERIVVSLADLSRMLNMKSGDVVPVALLLESEPWASGGNFRRAEEWRIHVTDEIEAYQDLGGWVDYLKMRINRHGGFPFSLIDYSIPWVKELLGEPAVRENSDFVEKVFSSLAPHDAFMGVAPFSTNSVNSGIGGPAKSDEVQQFDIAIVCALRTPELEKVLKTGKSEWKRLPSVPDDLQTYYQGLYVTSSGAELRVVAAALNQMGPPAAAVLTTKMIFRFQPLLVATVGVAAGVRVDPMGFGDILAPSVVFDYTAGKIVDDAGRVAFRPDPQPIEINQRFISLLKDWQADDEELFRIWRDWQGPRPERHPKLRIGPLGSGSAVVAHRQIMEETSLHWRKLIGLEMEAYAVHCACRDATTPATLCLSLKSVCDFADSGKNDEWQPYAAYTAAECFYRFIRTEWDGLHLSRKSSR